MEYNYHFDNECSIDVESDYEVTISDGHVTICKKYVLKFSKWKYKEEDNDPEENPDLEQGSSSSKCCMDGTTPSGEPTLKRLKLPNQGNTGGERNVMKPIGMVKPIPKVRGEPTPPTTTTEMDEITDPNDNENEDANENETDNDRESENQGNRSLPWRALATILNVVGDITFDIFMWMSM